MARFPTSIDCLWVRLKGARKLGFVVYIARTMWLFLNLNLDGVTFSVVDSIMHTVPFNPSNMITSLIPNFKQLQEAAVVLKESFSTEVATETFYFP